jgi:uracil-DNA glycosylase
MMWGAKAQAYKKHFSPKKHLHIIAPHPAASSHNSNNTEFFDHKPFSKANAYLKKWGKEEVDWSLPEEGEDTSE